MAKTYHVVLVAYDGFNPDEPEADGVPTMDYADIKSPALQNLYIFFLTGFSFWLIGKAGSIRKKLVCRMMGRTEESFDRIVYKNATRQSWVNQDKCMIGRHRNFELFKRTDKQYD